MNRILLLNEDMLPDKTALLTGRRLSHLREILGKIPGDTVRTGLIGSKCGTALIERLSDTQAVLSPLLNEEPPAKIPLTVVIAMQRPKTLRKVIQCATAMGVPRIFIIKTWRTEKSYFSNDVLSAEGLLDEVILGLEQSGDTIPPEIQIRKRFRPFVEDELPQIALDSLKLAAHPYSENLIPRGVGQPVTLAIGPEGGFIPFEIDLLEQQGFSAVTLGSRILRTEHALPAIIGRMF